MDLPFVEACFNGLALMWMLLGYLAIRINLRQVHRFCMGIALLCSAIFLGCYVVYHLTSDAVYYLGEWRMFYYSILISHIILAAVTPFLVGITAYRAIKGEWDRHRWWAKRTLPIWAYVSITGIMVYYMVHV